MVQVDYVFAFTNGYVSTISTDGDIDYITIGDVVIDGSSYGAVGLNLGTRATALVSSSGGFSFAQDGWFSRS